MTERLQSEIIYDAGTLATVIENLVSLNEIVANLFFGLRNAQSPDGEYTKLVYATLCDLSWKLGYKFNGDSPSVADIEGLSL